MKGKKKKSVHSLSPTARDVLTQTPREQMEQSGDAHGASIRQQGEEAREVIDSKKHDRGERFRSANSPK